MSKKDPKQQDQSFIVKLIHFVLTYSFIIVIPLSLLYLPGTILLDIEPEEFNVPLPNSLDKYEQNVHIKSFSHFVQVHGPESLALYQGRMVTGSSDGYLYEINFQSQNPSAKRLIRLVDNDTMNKTNLFRHGRPLGLRFDSKGNLWIVEPCFGVFKITNLFSSNYKKELIFDINLTSELGPPSVFLDDVAIEEKASGGYVLYITDVSSKYALKNAPIILLTSNYEGRILRYETDSGKLEAIVENLFFPNGIEMIDKNKGIMFSEYGSRNIWTYNFQGPDKNQAKLLLYGMPSETDNIRPSLKGQTYWLAMNRPRSGQNPSLFDRILKYPLLRKMILRFFYLFGSSFEIIHKIVPIDLVKYLAKTTKSLELFNFLEKEFAYGGMVLEIDVKGNIITSLYNLDETIYSAISEVRELPSSNSSERILLLASYAYPSIRKMIISNNDYQ